MKHDNLLGPVPLWPDRAPAAGIALAWGISKKQALEQLRELAKDRHVERDGMHRWYQPSVGCQEHGRFRASTNPQGCPVCIETDERLPQHGPEHHWDCIQRRYPQAECICAELYATEE